MTSVQCTDGDYLGSGDEPDITADCMFSCWFKNTSYAPALNAPLISWDDTVRFVVFFIPSGSTVIRALIFDGTNVDSVDIATGSYTGWGFGAFRHANGSTAWTVDYRKEGETSLTQATLDTGNPIATPTQIRIGANGIDEFVIDASFRSFVARSDRPTDGDLLTYSTSLSAPAGSNQAFLDLDSPTNAGDNQGTGLDYTVTGTLQTDATEPDPSIGGGGGGDILTSTRLGLGNIMADNSRLNAKPRWRRRGAIYVPACYGA